MFTIHAITDFAKFYKEVGYHFVDHFSGCEEYRDGKQELDIDIELFQTMLDIGVMNIFVMLEESEVVGYLNLTITPSPLFKTEQATVDFLYVLPQHREKGYTKLALEAIEKELLSKDIFDFNILLPEKDYSEEVARGLGFSKTSNIYTKILGE